MTALYGHKWSTSFGEAFDESDVAGRTWQSGLAGVSAQQVADGLHRCIERDEPWPPSLPEFHKLCIGEPKRPTDEWKAQKADPRMKPSPERLAWHQANIAWIKAGNELPRPGFEEPPAPQGAVSFWDVYAMACEGEVLQRSASDTPTSPARAFCDEEELP